MAGPLLYSRRYQLLDIYEPLLCAQITPSLYFGMIFVRSVLDPANIGGMRFRKYTPLLYFQTK